MPGYGKIPRESSNFLQCCLHIQLYPPCLKINHVVMQPTTCIRQQSTPLPFLDFFLLQFRLQAYRSSYHSPSYLPQDELTAMDAQKKFPEVYWTTHGGISFVYEVHPRIAVKVPRVGEEEREQFQKELKIYEIFSQHPPCPSIVQCFLYTEKGIFLEYMRGETPDPRCTSKNYDLIRRSTDRVIR